MILAIPAEQEVGEEAERGGTDDHLVDETPEEPCGELLVHICYLTDDCQSRVKCWVNAC